MNRQKKAEMKNQEKAQFSIYKLNQEEIIREISLYDSKADSDFAERVCEAFCEKLKQNVKSDRQNALFSFGRGKKFRGMIYKTFHTPAWKGVAVDLLDTEEENRAWTEHWFENVNVSYIILYAHERSIYAMTGGLGNHMIRKYIEKNWGLHLLPKLVQRDMGLIRQLKEHQMLGNTLSISKANRRMTNFILESDMDRIFKELSVEIGSSIGRELGITYKETEKKEIAVLFADFILIRKQVTLEDLEEIIKKISELEKRDDQFSLGYFTDIRRKGIRAGELLELLIKDLQQKRFENLQFVGEDYLEFYQNSFQYELLQEDGGCYYSSEKPLLLEDIFEVLEEDPKLRLSRTFLRTFLKKWRVRTLGEDGKEKIHPTPVLGMLQGFVNCDDSGIPCYLIQSKWYCLDDRYLPYIDRSFMELYDKYERKSQVLREKFDFTSSKVTEDDYNDDFLNKKEFLVGHKTLLDGYEIADIFFWDEKNVYLMCNKMYFDGNGSRDLTNQIFASARYFQKRLASENRKDALKKLYQGIFRKYKAASLDIPLDEEQFFNLFQKRQLCYVAGYMENYRRTARSPYARYFTVDLNRRLQELGYSCIVMGIR